MRKILAPLVAVATVLVTATAAGAEPTTPDYTSDVTSLATDGLASVAPIVLAVAGVAVGIAALRFGIRFVMGAVRTGGNRV